MPETSHRTAPPRVAREALHLSAARQGGNAVRGGFKCQGGEWSYPQSICTSEVTLLGASQPLLVTCCLPFLDSLYRVDQHHYVQGEVISDPEGLRNLRQHKQSESATEP